MTFPRILVTPLLIGATQAASLLIEAEQFANKGGWKVDTQFIESMGSPYLIAHGMGSPVADASTTVQVPEDGDYRIWVRTIDWSERLDRAGGAGRFTLSVDGQPLGETLGKGAPQWTWESVGTTPLKAGSRTLKLHDQSGFNGRVDAILLSNDPDFTPPGVGSLAERTKWSIDGVPTMADELGDFDLVVVGGGYGGLGSAISAARMGARVALIQNRKVLGGNGSSEVRVWAKGNFPPNQYPLADIVKEFTDSAKASPAPAEQFEDDKKTEIVRAEKNITLLLGHHAYGVEKEGDQIKSIKVLDIEGGRVSRISGKLFVDCTGHGFIGDWAGADKTMAEGGRMGMSNMWMWENTGQTVAFPEEDWMVPFKESDFPYPRRNHAEWFWESGYDRHPILELEQTRDWNLAVSYSAWNAIKNHGAHAKRDPHGHQQAKMTWLAYIGGTRETQQLLGDVILTGDEIVAKDEFPDACVRVTWSIDLHVPQEQYLKATPDRPFISRAIHGKGVDRNVGYPIPYRCFYSRNIPNLFMVGRNISVDRRALGTTRVMNTIGMMGVVVGRAAALATVHDCTPRDIYQKHLDEVKQLWLLPGKHRFESLDELRDSLQPSAAE
ncbi:FAD-dependent oxidoreductase [Haloferula rosea]|uniref:FAD-dependent oxidoreductase n=1 Tax=Haloferula rosea TaxID=490093 RepID=A0A934VGQ4_9BACT|nr:FAD-dependent oxidoreductase [Haloferula rosea]MBK1828301.1 FAD-dependent oxidoreductase [Haloferula rosea]